VGRFWGGVIQVDSIGTTLQARLKDGKKKICQNIQVLQRLSTREKFKEVR